MHIGIFSAVFQDLPFEQAMDKIAELGFECGRGKHRQLSLPAG